MLIDVYGDQINKMWSSLELDQKLINGFSGNRRGWYILKGGDSGSTIGIKI
jgi:hypothetical protein